jgi:hypothetical protein
VVAQIGPAWWVERHALGGYQNPQRRLPGWRSFGEYIFLEDSRYASQQENAPRKRFVGDPLTRSARIDGCRPREGV